MRVVLDTNIMVSALLIQLGHPAAIYRAWQEGYFTLFAEIVGALPRTNALPILAIIFSSAFLKRVGPTIS